MSIVTVYMYLLGIDALMSPLFRLAFSHFVYMYLREFVFTLFVMTTIVCFRVVPAVIRSLVLSVLCFICIIVRRDVWESPCRVDSTTWMGILQGYPLRCNCEQV